MAKAKYKGLKRLDRDGQCGICGRKLHRGALIKHVTTRERNDEIICASCVMKHKQLLTMSVDDEKANSEMRYRRAKNRGQI